MRSLALSLALLLLLLLPSPSQGQVYQVKDPKDPSKGFTVPFSAVDHERRLHKFPMMKKEQGRPKTEGPVQYDERLPPINEPHPRHENPNVGLQFTTVKSQHQALPLKVEGVLPDWVDGVMLRNGFAKFEAERMKFNFLFDVAAGLVRFEVRGGNVTFTNRILESEYTQHAVEKGVFPNTITFGGTEPPSNCPLASCGSWMLHDNLNVGVWRLGERYFAISDFRPLTEFDPVSLAYRGRFRFPDQFDDPLYMITCAHPVPQPDGSGYAINYLGRLDVPLMLRNTYEFYRVKGSDPDARREPIAKIQSRDLAYVHSFAVTEHYIVFAQFPLFYDLLGIPLTGGPLVDLLNWEPSKGTRVWVINHQTGEVIQEYVTEAFFAYHHVNAFEDERGDVFFDISAFDDASHLFYFFLDEMRQGPSHYPCSQLRRYHVPVATGGEISYTVAHPACHDLPRINEQHWARRHRYVYAAGEYDQGDMYNCIIKMDTENPAGTTLTWAVHDNYPSEPLFVPRPGATEEDDGVLLSVVLDGQKAQSFLLVLDAKSFAEVARAYVPPFLPFMSHGQFYEK